MNQKKRRRIWINCLLLLCLLFVSAKNVDAASRIRINKTSAKTQVGYTVKLKLSGVSSKQVTWSSSNKSVATVNKGTVKALKGGSATITAKAKGKKYRCRVTVVAINKTQLTLAPSDTYQLKTQNGKNTKWSSSNSSIASVSSKGLVKAQKSGKVTITCKTNDRTLKCYVYVPELSDTNLRIHLEEQKRITVKNAKESVRFTSSNVDVVSVKSDGTLTAVSPGAATVSCKTGAAQLDCAVTVMVPDNIVTPMRQLPLSSKGDRLKVTINGYPKARTYIVYHQADPDNKTDGKETVKMSYMPNHGCAACALSTVLSGYANMTAGPIYTTEKIEKQVFGTAVWKKNHSKSDAKSSKDKPDPMSIYGISKVLSYYKIPSTYVRYFPGSKGTNGKIKDNTTADALACKQIEAHLKTGNPVVIVVSQKNRKTNKKDSKWANSYHTMVLLGMTDNGKVIVADAADRADYFGSQRRLKYVYLKDLIPYMFSSTNVTSSKCLEPYWPGAGYCGGYLLVNPQLTE